MSFIEKSQEELFNYRRELTQAFENKDELEVIRLRNIINRRLKQIYKYNIEQIENENKKGNFFNNLILKIYKKK
jgi:hypothetical protein